jgi:ribonuclease P protein component
LKKEFRIKKRRDFVRASQSGFSFRAHSVVLQCGFNDLDAYRVGFTASKRVGNAVIRNLCKRRMRAVADMTFPEVGLAGVDYILIARKFTGSVDWDTLVEEVMRAVVFLNGKMLKCKKS